MKLKKLAASALAVGTGVLGVGLATASPAAAAAGTWRPYGNTNPITSSSSSWYCGGTVTVTTSVGAQVCAVVSPGGGAVQTAVIVRNNKSSLYGVEAAADLTTAGGDFIDRWSCARSGVGANSWSVCFGATITLPSDFVRAAGGANGVNLPVSPYV